MKEGDWVCLVVVSFMSSDAMVGASVEGCQGFVIMPAIVSSEQTSQPAPLKFPSSLVVTGADKTMLGLGSLCVLGGPGGGSFGGGWVGG